MLSRTVGGKFEDSCWTRGDCPVARSTSVSPDDKKTPLQRLPHSVSARVLYMPAQGVTKVKMGPEEAARKSAPQNAGSPGRRKTGALPRHRAYTSWEDENKENIDPRTRKATATSPAKLKALSPTKTDNVVKPTRPRRRRNAIVPVGSPRCVSDLQNAFAALAVAARR